MPKGSGFTLIELLITISILALLSTIAMVSFSSFMKNGRDAKRQADLKTIQSVLESYYADQLYYPLQDSSDCPEQGDGKFRLNCNLTSPNGRKNYFNKLPSDPHSSNAEYSYQPKPVNCNNVDIKCRDYCLFADMEGLETPKSEGDCNPDEPYDFAVKKP